MLQVQLHLFKADIDAAYRRRILVKPRHFELAHVAFMREGEILVSAHRGMPFGAVASVHNWNRVGAQHVPYASGFPFSRSCRFLFGRSGQETFENSYGAIRG